MGSRGEEVLTQFPTSTTHVIPLTVSFPFLIPLPSFVSPYIPFYSSLIYQRASIIFEKNHNILTFSTHVFYTRYKINIDGNYDL